MVLKLHFSFLVMGLIFDRRSWMIHYVAKLLIHSLSFVCVIEHEPSQTHYFLISPGHKACLETTPWVSESKPRPKTCKAFFCIVKLQFESGNQSIFYILCPSYDLLLCRWVLWLHLLQHAVPINSLQLEHSLTQSNVHFHRHYIWLRKSIQIAIGINLGMFSGRIQFRNFLDTWGLMSTLTLPKQQTTYRDRLTMIQSYYLLQLLICIQTPVHTSSCMQINPCNKHAYENEHELKMNS